MRSRHAGGQIYRSKRNKEGKERDNNNSESRLRRVVASVATLVIDFTGLQEGGGGPDHPVPKSPRDKSAEYPDQGPRTMSIRIKAFFSRGDRGEKEKDSGRWNLHDVHSHAMAGSKTPRDATPPSAPSPPSVILSGLLLLLF
jgi:hypothetical protein